MLFLALLWGLYLFYVLHKSIIFLEGMRKQQEIIFGEQVRDIYIYLFGLKIVYTYDMYTLGRIAIAAITYIDDGLFLILPCFTYYLITQ